MADIFIKKANNFIFMHEVQYGRQNPGYLNVWQEMWLKFKNVNCLTDLAEKILAMLNAFIKFVANS